MKKTQYENFGEWVKNFALNLTNIWNEPSARMLDPSKDQTYDKNKHSAIIIGRGPSIKKHDHLKLLAESDYQGSIICCDGKLIDVSISASPLIDPKTKKLIGDIVSMRDISERILAQKSRDELEQNRKLTTLIQGHIEDERRSLARELHDELGQYVSAIKIFAQNINNKSSGNKDIKMSASSVTSAANQIYDGMHNIIRKLRPSALDNLGLSETIKDSVSSWQKQHKNQSS